MRNEMENAASSVKAVELFATTVESLLIAGSYTNMLVSAVDDRQLGPNASYLVFSRTHGTGCL